MPNLSRRSVQYFTITILFVINFSIWFAVFRADRSGELVVAFLDVGQGDAIYIEAPNGNQMLVDGGPPNNAVLRELASLVPFWDRTLDVVLASHSDQDHIGGLSAVVDRMRVGVFVATENTSDTSVRATLEGKVKEKHLRRVVARAGERIILDDGVEFEVLFPDRNAESWETNTASVVGVLRYGNESFLLPGDAPQSVEKYLVKTNPEKLRASVLKLGHHGSRTSSAAEFLSAVNPKYAVISVGEGNRYGHPHQEVLELLSKSGLHVVSTAEQGTLVFRTGGDGLAK